MENVAITGSNGFLGKALVETLSKEFNVIVVTRDQFDFKSSNEISFIKRPNIIIHCAGIAHFVPTTPSDSRLFFEINYEGTKRFLQALEVKEYIPESFIYISSVSVYGLSKGIRINETQELSATDPYGKSKILAEKLILDWCTKNNVLCSILRLPLIVGSDPKGNLHKMIQAIESGYYFNVDSGKAKKSMVYIGDICEIIPKVAQIGGIYNLTDTYHPSFGELASIISRTFGKSRVFNLPLPMARYLAKIGDLLGQKSPFNTSTFEKMSSDLTFDDTKAIQTLDWKPKLVLDIFNDI